MSRLIDADELIEIAHEMIQEDPVAFNGGYSYDEVTVEEINEAPTVEAVPVVHGEWILEEKAGIDYWCCSHCDKIRSEYYAKPKDNFCPNCGTYMRKKV